MGYGPEGSVFNYLVFTKAGKILSNQGLSGPLFS